MQKFRALQMEAYNKSAGSTFNPSYPRNYMRFIRQMSNREYHSKCLKPQVSLLGEILQNIIRPMVKVTESKIELTGNERRTKCAIQVMKQLTVSGYCHGHRLGRWLVLFKPFSTKVVSPDNTMKKSLAS